ncbi:TauD/TfdA dioxygenase family protein [Corynebacterium kroppenstedtii]|uniref:(3R)-3-[(carboxymethyl)amino]fatty acid oxygenase/decarboxylase n=1 Tax=Corynebacterium sp. PCR 32 TaxID=3351342 RepID=UPI0030AE37E0
MTLTTKGHGLGTQVFGIDPVRIAAGEDTQELRNLVYTHKLIVLKDITPTPEEFLNLGRALGTVRPYYEPMYHHPEFPDIFVSSNEQKTTGTGVPKTGAFWHIDYQFMPEPFALTMTLPLAVPGSDRGTYFIDMAEAWRRIPTQLQDNVRGTTATHSPRRYVKIRPSDVYRPIGDVIRDIEETTPPQQWPTVLTHPVTGEEILYICEAFTESIHTTDGDTLEPRILHDLLEHSGQLDDTFHNDLIHTQHFGVGDALLWDNRVLAHRAKHGTVQGTVTTHRVTMLDGLATPGHPA